MCDFKFIDFTPEEIIKIMKQDIKQFQKKYDHHISAAKHYQTQIDELEVKVGKLRHKIRKENKDDI